MAPSQMNVWKQEQTVCEREVRPTLRQHCICFHTPSRHSSFSLQLFHKCTSLTYSLALTHTPTLKHTSRCLATIHFFTCTKKLWTCWLSIAEMFCETFSETSFTFKTAPKTWTTNCNHSKSALTEWCKLPSSSENVKRFQQTHKKTHSRCDILALRLASLTSISPLIGSEYCRWAK